RSGSVPVRIRWATRCASVLVLPVPAPAMISSGPWISALRGYEMPCSTAARWARFRSRRYAGESVELGSAGLLFPSSVALPRGNDRRVVVFIGGANLVAAPAAKV